MSSVLYGYGEDSAEVVPEAPHVVCNWAMSHFDVGLVSDWSVVDPCSASSINGNVDSVWTGSVYYPCVEPSVCLTGVVKLDLCRPEAAVMVSDSLVVVTVYAGDDLSSDAEGVCCVGTPVARSNCCGELRLYVDLFDSETVMSVESVLVSEVANVI